MPPFGVRGRNSNNDVVRRELGWDYSQTLEEGIRKTYAWISEQIAKRIMKIEIVKQHVKDLDISHLRDMSLNQNDWLPAGQSEYRLYAYLSTFFNKAAILDIGTRTGGSACNSFL
jgi:hypothetical protein